MPCVNRRPVLLRLAQRFGDSFFLLVADGHQVLCLDMLTGELPVQGYSGAVGGRIPMGGPSLAGAAGLARA